MLLQYEPLVRYKVFSNILVLDVDVDCIAVDVLHYQYRPNKIQSPLHSFETKIPEGISFLHNDNTPFTTLSPPDDNICADIIAKLNWYEGCWTMIRVFKSGK